MTEFEFRNPVRLTPRGWSVGAKTQTAGDISFTLGEVTVERKPMNPFDIWTQTITFPFRVEREGVLLTNWIPAYIRGEDSSGNFGLNTRPDGFDHGWVIQRGWRGLDPRQIWRVEVDFEMEPPTGSVFVIPLSSVIAAPMVTNCTGIAVTLSGTAEELSVSIPTNRTDVALKFISLRDQTRKDIGFVSGSWSQHRFIWTFYSLPAGKKPNEVVFAIVPAHHATFLTQPRLMIP